jgi:hypothetical protein
MTINKALLGYLVAAIMLLAPTEGWSQTPLPGLATGVTVTVHYIWFRDSGAAGGGFWLAATGQVMSATDQFVVLNVGATRQIIRWGAITFIDFKP